MYEKVLRISMEVLYEIVSRKQFNKTVFFSEFKE